jgi:hypothetical protein
MIRILIKFIVPIVFSFSFGYIFYIRNKVSELHRRISYFSIATLLIIFLIPLYQEPECLEYYIYLLPFVLFVVMIVFWQIRMLIKSNRLHNSVYNFLAIIFISVFILNNFVFGILPLSKVINNEYFEEFTFLKDNIKNNNLVVVLSDRGNFFDLGIWYLNRLISNDMLEVLPVDYKYCVEERYYRWIFDRVKDCENIAIFIIPRYYSFSDDTVSKIKGSEILKVDKKNINSLPFILARDFLDKLGSSHDFAMIANNKVIRCSLFSCWRKNS